MATILKWPNTLLDGIEFWYWRRFNEQKKTWSQIFMGEGCTVTHSDPWTSTKNDRKIRSNSCLDIFHKTETFFIGIIKLLAPKNICINTNFVTQTALELKLWHKTWFPNFNGDHFENSPTQVVHPNIFLMASTFDIGGGPRSKTKLGLRLPWGGGGVHGNPKY